MKKFSADFVVYTPLACVIVDYGDDTDKEAYGHEDTCKSRFPDVPLTEMKDSSPFTLSHNYS